MATLNGARSLGLANEIGSLLPGKAADLICIDMQQPATTPVYNPLSQVVYAASRDQISDVWVAGEALLADGQFTRAAAADVMERATAWRDRVVSGHD
jgi:5-methylthioadenosine/S-adenosylhomocysteine deaminase